MASLEKVKGYFKNFDFQKAFFFAAVDCQDLVTCQFALAFDAADDLFLSLLQAAKIFQPLNLFIVLGSAFSYRINFFHFFTMIFTVFFTLL